MTHLEDKFIPGKVCLIVFVKGEKSILDVGHCNLTMDTKSRKLMAKGAFVDLTLEDVSSITLLMEEKDDT